MAGSERNGTHVALHRRRRDKKRQLREQLRDVGVIDQLTPRQHIALINLVERLCAGYALFHSHPKAAAWLRTDAAYGAGQRRKFLKKMKKAVDSVNEALTYAAQVQKPSAQGNELLSRAMHDRAVPFLEQAAEALRTIDLVFSGSDAPVWTRLRPEVREVMFKEPRAEAMTVLSSFFAAECHLGRRDADRRTALIGNHLWSWNIAVDDEYKDGSAGASGSSAVRKHRLRRAASSKKR